MSDREYEQEESRTGRDLAALGLVVRGVREGRGISVPQASEATRIRGPHIEAIEEGRLEDLPGRVYARGFLRSYLSFLEAGDLWPEFDRLLPLEERSGLSQVMGSVRPPAKGFHRNSKWWLYVLLVLGLVVSVMLVWKSHSSVHVQEEAQPAISQTGEGVLPQVEQEVEVLKGGISIVEEIPTSEDRALMEAVEPLSDEALLPASGETSEDLEWLRELSVDVKAVEEARQEPVLTDVLVMDFTSACWVRVKEGEKILFQGTLKAGDSRTYQVKAATSVRFGNANAVNLSWRGEEHAPLAGRAAVLEVVFNPGEPLERR